MLIYYDFINLYKAQSTDGIKYLIENLSNDLDFTVQFLLSSKITIGPMGFNTRSVFSWEFKYRRIIAIDFDLNKFIAKRING